MSKLIKITPCYYVGTYDAPRTAYLMDAEGRDLLRFGSEEDAQSYIDDLESGTYYLAHGEAGRPSYEIVGEEDIDSSTLDAVKMLPDDYNGWSMVDAGDVPAEIKAELDSANVDASDYDDDSTTYIAYAGDYAIAYVVSSEVEEYASVVLGDLSWIDWDRPAYFYTGGE